MADVAAATVYVHVELAPDDLDAITAAVERAVTAGIQRATNPIAVTVDGEQIARTIRQVQRDEKRRNGESGTA